MSKLVYAISLISLLVLPGWVRSQNNLELFGYFQINLAELHAKASMVNSALGFQRIISDDRNSFNVQQLNLLMRKQINDDFSAWINLEIKNNYSSENFWGAFNLQEAWVRYYDSKKVIVKAGLLIPQFNNLNEVKNRMPYLPYIIRPVVYESSFSELIDQDDFAPSRAYVQMYGTLPAAVSLDYAFFVGNSDEDFLTGQPTYTTQSGVDTTGHFLLGARLGISRGSIKAGFSSTYDKDEQSALGQAQVPRFRLGGDFSFSCRRLFFESEVIRVLHDLNNPNLSINKLFYYATLGYDLNDRLFGYVSHSHLEDNGEPALARGINGYSVGGGYRLIESLVFKLQYAYFRVGKTTLPPSVNVPIPVDFDFYYHTANAAISVSF